MFKIIKTLFLLLLFLAPPLFIFTTYPIRHSEIIEKYAQKYGLEPSLVYAVINTESGFRADALSPKGAKGLMQIMDKTGEWGFQMMEMGGDFYPDMLYDPEINIAIGCWYLNRLILQYRDVNTALAAYNAGSGNVSKWL